MIVSRVTQTVTRISNRAHVRNGTHIPHFLTQPFVRAAPVVSRLFPIPGLFYRELVLCHVLEIELIEMGEPAVPAPDGKMPAPDREVMRTCDFAVPALRRLDKLPEIIAPDLCESSRFRHLFDAGDKDPCRPAVGARNLCLVGHRLYYLVYHLFAVVTIGAVFREDEPVAHKRYWSRAGSLTCCRQSVRPKESGGIV